MKCSWCGKEFTVLYPDMWRYKANKKWFCTWKCLRADEKGDKEMPRMKKDGTPAKKPGPKSEREKYLARQKEEERKESSLERDRMVMEQLERKEKEEERLRNEMMGKPINLSGRFKPIDAMRQLEEKAQPMTTEDLEMAAAALINQDVPLTAEERSEKYPMIPTRIDTKAGTWEMFGEYKGDETLVGYTMRYDHGATPFKDSLRIVMTVEEWQKVCEQLDEVLRMMKL